MVGATYQTIPMDVLTELLGGIPGKKSKFLCIRSLVLEVKGLKQGYICKKTQKTFISVLSYLIYFKQV